jgi:hypothetical protein
VIQLTQSGTRDDSCIAHGLENQPVASPGEGELERLGDEIAELAAYLHAATHQLLVRLHEFDQRGGWSGGFKSCAHWLSWRTSIAPGAAREKVRVARALARLPLLSEAMGRGELSYAKVRAVTRVATPANEQHLLELARHGTAAQVEKVVRAWRRVNRLEELKADRARHEKRHVSLHVDDDGSYVLRGRLDPETGALLERALEAAELALFGKRKREAATPSDDAVDASTPAQRRADAIALIAETALRSEALAMDPREAPSPETAPATDPLGAPSSGAALATETRETTASRIALRLTGRADRFQVVVHVDAAALAEGSETGQSVLGDGIRVPAETSRRIACDASRVIITHDANGAVLDAGRRTRIVPPSIRRALEYRDRGCRFPGCNARFCDAHHIRHWADGGSTRLDNLTLLCRTHHRLVHEGGYRLMMTPCGEVEVVRPDGRPLPRVPAAPQLPDDPVSALTRSHRQAGLAIDAWTPTPLWGGERLDVGHAVRVFCALRE